MRLLVGVALEVLLLVAFAHVANSFTPSSRLTLQMFGSQIGTPELLASLASQPSRLTLQMVGERSQIVTPDKSLAIELLTSPTWRRALVVLIRHQTLCSNSLNSHLVEL